MKELLAGRSRLLSRACCTALAASTNLVVDRPVTGLLGGATGKRASEYCDKDHLWKPQVLTGTTCGLSAY